MRFFTKIQNTFALKTNSVIVWFSCLGLWKIGNKWPFFFLVWQIFWGQTKHKNYDKFLRKNSWNVCLVKTSQHWIGWPGMSAELSVNSVDNTFIYHGFLTTFLTILVQFKWITIFAVFLFHRFDLPKCRFFALSRKFDWIYEIFWRICPKIEWWTMESICFESFCLDSYFDGGIFCLGK